MRQVGFNGIDAVVEQGSRGIWFVENVRFTSLNTLDTVKLQDVIEDGFRGARNQNGVVDPIALEINFTAC